MPGSLTSILYTKAPVLRTGRFRLSRIETRRIGSRYRAEAVDSKTGTVEVMTEKFLGDGETNGPPEKVARYSWGNRNANNLEHAANLLTPTSMKDVMNQLSENERGLTETGGAPQEVTDDMRESERYY